MTAPSTPARRIPREFRFLNSHTHKHVSPSESGSIKTLRALLEGISDPTVLLDRALRVVYANAQARLRFSSSTFTLHDPFLGFLGHEYPAADLSGVEPTLAGVIHGPGAGQPAMVFLHDGERQVHLRASLVDCGCCGDATDPFQPVLGVVFAEPDSQRLLPRLELVLESSTDGVFIVNRENRIVYFNHACERMTGWQRDAAVMTTWECSNVLHCHNEEGESMGHDHLCPAKLFFHSGSVPAPREMLITATGGKERWVETNYSPIRNQSGEIEFIVGIIRDVDERKSLETQLVQNRNLASLGQLVSGIAHEIKNPLGILMAGVEVLLSGERTDAQRREAALCIKDEVRRLDDRVKDFLAFARPKPVMAERVNLNAILKKAAMTYSSLGSGRLRIDLRLSRRAPFLLADPDQLHQVFLNLVINADQAMPRGGELGVSTEIVEDRVRVLFTDEGCGIREDNLPRVFEPFFTTKKDGTGLGLPIVHQILTAHRGRITMRNNPGGGPGVTVEMLLPLAALPAPAVAAAG